MSSSDEEEVEYEEELFDIREYLFRITTVSFMPLAKLMAMRENHVEISGQKLWCGSLVVMEYLLDHSDFIRNCNIIELGAGTGCIGMLCRKLGCEKVWLTDHDNRSLTHMNQDILTNGIEAEVVKLNWFDFDMSSHASDPFFLEKDMVVVAGDVLYKNDLLEPFFGVVRSILQLPNSKMLLCHVPRAGVEQDTVKAAAFAHGLDVEEVDESEWKKGVCLTYSIPEDYDRARLYVICASESK
jgi:predicted nicotinamide N-methyase